MDTETAGAQNALSKQEAHGISGRPPTMVMTSTTNLIQLESDLEEHIKEIMSSEIHEMEPIS
jgi:hypothetical protein